MIQRYEKLRAQISAAFDAKGGIATARAHTEQEMMEWIATLSPEQVELAMYLAFVVGQDFGAVPTARTEKVTSQ